MSKRLHGHSTEWRPVAYEAEFAHLDKVMGASTSSASDKAGDLPGLATSTALEPVRQAAPKAWTPAQAPNSPELAHKLINTVMQAPAMGEIDSVFTPVEGAHDATSAKDRAAALSVKMTWQVIMLGGAGFAILLVCLLVGAWVERPGTGFFVGAVVALVLIFTVGSDRLNQMIADDNAYSREGTERHRIDRAVDVQLARLEHDAEIKKMALGAVLKQLGVRDGQDG